jgi:nitrous oxidase accessory protein NosD
VVLRVTLVDEAGNRSQPQEFSFEAIGIGAILQVSPTSLSFSSEVGRNPASQTVQITNAGTGTLNWNATADQPWINLNPASGTAPSTITVSLNAVSLAAGSYSGRITISAPGAQGSPVTVFVILSLTPVQPAILQVSPSYLSFRGEEGGRDPDPQVITIRNAGSSTMNWTAAADSFWLRLSADRGSLAGGLSTEVRVSVSLTGLAAGTYTGRVTVTAPGAQGSPVTVTVSLTVEPRRPAYTVCPSGCRYSSISSAIAAARSGEIITIGPGTYSENLSINKSLTLHGAGREQTTIKGAISGWPVINIESDSEIEVVLEGLTIAEAKGSACAVCDPQWIFPDGIRVKRKAIVTIKSAQISDNLSGLQLWSSARVYLQDSRVSSNRAHGLVVWGSTMLEIRSSTIEGNGTGPDCVRADSVCHGIEVAESPQLTIIDSTIRNNTDWGIAAYLKKCGYGYDAFYGKVIFRGSNQIYGNNKAGNHQGEVCLP